MKNLNKIIKILLVEDNPVDILLIKKALKESSYGSATLFVAESLEAAIRFSKENIPVLLLDLNLPDSNGLSTVREIHTHFPNSALIILTAMEDENIAVETLREGAQNYVNKKEINNKVLDKTIRFSLERHLTIQKLRTADKELIFQNEEKEKRAAELTIANKELVFQNDEKEKRAAELIIANKELKKTQEELRVTHERLLFHLENTSLGFIEWDGQLQIKSLSKQAEKIFGWSLEEFAEKERTGYSQVYKGDQPWVNKMSEQLLAGEIERNKVQHRNYTKDGKVIWCEWFNSVLKDKDGKVVTVISLVQDITDSKKTEENMQKIIRELSDYKYALDESSIVAITDQKGIIKHVNDNFCGISKYRREELIGQDHRIVNSGYHSKEFIRNLWTTIANGKIWRGELKNKAKDGSIYWVDTTIVPFLDEHGKPYQYIAIRADITPHKAMEETLVRSEARLNEAQSLSHISNWEIDLLTNTNTWSDQFYHIFGIQRGDIQPSPEAFLSLLHPEDVNHIRERVENAFKTFEDSSFNSRMKTKDGSTRFVYSEWRFEFDQNHNPIRLYGILQDITDRKAAEEEREKIAADLVQRNKDLEQFTYIISHNLRAPVANIIGISEALRTMNLEETEKEEMMFSLSASVIKLNGVILDLNQILQTRHNVSEKRDTVSFSHLIKNIKLSIDNQIKKEKVEIKTDFTEIDKMLTLKSYLYSIFYNLISNSIKYRQPKLLPVIEIKSFKLKDKIELSYSDNGLGIDLTKQGELVFGLYKRFHTHREGKGMGLFMVKTQVEALGGKINIESCVNKGTKFIIQFPL